MSGWITDLSRALGLSSGGTKKDATGRRLGTAEEAAAALALKRDAAAAAAAAEAAAGAGEARGRGSGASAVAASAAVERAARSGPPKTVAFQGAKHRLGDSSSAKAPVHATSAATASARAGTGLPPPQPAAQSPPSAQLASPLAPPPAPLLAPLSGAAALLASDAEGRRASHVLARLLRNVLDSPRETKFRSVRLANAAISAAVQHTAGGLELLQEAGFELVFQDVTGEGGETATEGFVVLPLPDDEGIATQLVAVRAALESLSSLLVQPA